MQGPEGLQPLVKRFISWALVLVAGCGFFVRPRGLDLRVEEIPEAALNGLSRVRSFRFSYRLWREGPPRVELQFDGVCVLSGQEERRGYQRFDSESTWVWLMGFDDIEYELRGGGWSIHPRGEETDLLTQLRRVMGFGNFKLIEEGQAGFVFRFQPNLAFLDPTFEKELWGVMEVGRGDLLPRRVEAQDSAGTIGLLVELWGYNRVQRLVPPVATRTLVRLSYGELPPDSNRMLGERISSRFGELGFSVRFDPEAKTLTVNGPISQARVESLLSLGESGLYRVGSNRTSSVQICGPEGLGRARVGFDRRHRPFIQLGLSRTGVRALKALAPGESWALAIDGEVLTSGLDPSREGRSIKWSNGLGYWELMRTAAIINSGPLPTRVSVAAIEKEGLRW